jgi:hypothetical protein
VPGPGEDTPEQYDTDAHLVPGKKAYRTPEQPAALSAKRMTIPAAMTICHECGAVMVESCWDRIQHQESAPKEEPTTPCEYRPELCETCMHSSLWRCPHCQTDIKCKPYIVQDSRALIITDEKVLAGV